MSDFDGTFDEYLEHSIPGFIDVGISRAEAIRILIHLYNDGTLVRRKDNLDADKWYD